MSRTTLCIATAAGLITLSAGLMVARYRILGEEVLAPKGPGIWKVTLLVNGTSTSKDAKLMTATPIDFGHQHICRESCHSDEFLDKPPVARHPERRQVVWNHRGTKSPGAFRVRYEFYCQVDLHRAMMSGTHLSKALYAAPRGRILEQ